MGLAEVDRGLLRFELLEPYRVRVFTNAQLERAEVGAFLGALEHFVSALGLAGQAINERERHRVAGLLRQVFLDLNHLGRAGPHKLLEPIAVQVFAEVPFVPLLDC